MTTITIHIANDLATAFLDWIDDKGHSQFRKHLRVNEELEDSTHLQTVVDFTQKRVTFRAAPETVGE